MASAGLIQNNDFSSDLLLNKVMNGQYSANSGKTITLAGRVNASTMNAQATSYGVEAENVRKGSVYADALANSLSELLDIANRAAQANASMSGDALKAYGTQLKNEFETLLKTTVEGKKIFDTALSYDLGQGSGTVAIGGASGNFSGITNLGTLLGTISSGATVTATGSAGFEGAQSGLLADISSASAKAALFENRYNSLNDLITSYQNAANDQVVNSGGSSTSLLNNLLS